MRSNCTQIFKKTPFGYPAIDGHSHLFENPWCQSFRVNAMCAPIFCVYKREVVDSICLSTHIFYHPNLLNGLHRTEIFEKCSFLHAQLNPYLIFNRGSNSSRRSRTLRILINSDYRGRRNWAKRGIFKRVIKNQNKYGSSVNSSDILNMFNLSNSRENLV